MSRDRASPSLRLYDYYRSSASYRVRIALALKGLAAQSIETSLLAGDQRSEAYLAANPQGFVPMLEVAGAGMGGGPLRLTQSLAIIDWLDATVPEPRLIPDEPVARARALALAMVVAADIHPLNNLRVLKYLKSDLGLSDRVKDRWYAHWVAEGLGAMEAMAADGAQGRRGGPFLGGDRPDIADLFLVPQLYNARRFDLPLDEFPVLVAAEAACLALPAFADTSPDAVRARQDA